MSHKFSYGVGNENHFTPYTYDELTAEYSKKIWELEQKDAQIAHLRSQVKELVEEITNAVGYIRRHPENGMLVVGTLEAVLAKHRESK